MGANLRKCALLTETYKNEHFLAFSAQALRRTLFIEYPGLAWRPPVEIGLASEHGSLFMVHGSLFIVHCSLLAWASFFDKSPWPDLTYYDIHWP